MTRPSIYLWRGRTYVGQRAVAEAAGVAECTVSYHLITNGHLDRLGTGKGGRGKLRPPIVKPVHMAGHSWPSIAAFARSVGMSPKTAQKAVREGRSDKLLAALMITDVKRRAAA